MQIWDQLRKENSKWSYAEPSKKKRPATTGSIPLTKKVISQVPKINNPYKKRKYSPTKTTYNPQQQKNIARAKWAYDIATYKPNLRDAKKYWNSLNKKEVAVDTALLATGYGAFKYAKPLSKIGSRLVGGYKQTKQFNRVKAVARPLTIQQQRAKQLGRIRGARPRTLPNRYRKSWTNPGNYTGGKYRATYKPHNFQSPLYNDPYKQWFDPLSIGTNQLG